MQTIKIANSYSFEMVSFSMKLQYLLKKIISMRVYISLEHWKIPIPFLPDPSVMYSQVVMNDLVLFMRRHSFLEFPLLPLMFRQVLEKSFLDQHVQRIVFLKLPMESSFQKNRAIFSLRQSSIFSNTLIVFVPRQHFDQKQFRKNMIKR